MRTIYLITLFGAASIFSRTAVTAEPAGERRKDDTVTLLKTFHQEFIPITPGKGEFPAQFSMGRVEGGSGAARPVRIVHFDYHFFIARYEIPQNLWAAVMGSNPSRWQGPRNSVERVSYDEAELFCQKVTALLQAAKLITADQEVRLPSEAEWEYCARADTNTLYSFGKDARQIGGYAWHTGNASGNDPPVGAKKPNPWGLYDVHGYLWEWCVDPWHPSYQDAPLDGSAWYADGDPTKRVIRGGSWKDPAAQLASSFRTGVDRQTRDDAIGLRCVLTSGSRDGHELPNIVLIYTDDVGYGDISCYGATRVQTPHIDRLAREGLRFTDGHSPSATCTPSRYAMLTGEYAWRKKGTGVLRGDAPLIIEPGRATIASLLQERGYTTGVVGKWHLGLGRGNIDWNSTIQPGPLEIGFDYAFLMPATGDRVPCVYMENHRVVGSDGDDPIKVRFGKPIGNEPTGKAHPELLKMHLSHGHNQTIINGISRIGYMSGGKFARWVDEDMADVFVDKAVSFIERHKNKRFFLYFSTHDIHVPRVPHARFVGTTPLGPRGDVLVQMDWCVGELLAALDKHKLTDNTLVIFTSDNGPVVDDGYHDEAVEKLGDHKPTGPFRGGKYSAFEAGTRVPFIVRWPIQVKPGISSALVCQIDLLASFAALTGQSLVDGASPDSLNVLPTLLGKANVGRDHLVEHARTLALRQGPWKFIAPSKGPKINRNTNTELGLDSGPQLYHLGDDIGETNNLAAERPEKALELAELLDRIRASTSRDPVNREN